MKSLEIIWEDLYTKWRRGKKTDKDVVIIDKEGQDKQTNRVVAEEKHEMINMVQEFESMMIEEEDAGDLDAKEAEEFEIEVLFDSTKFWKKESLRKDVVVDIEENDMLSVDDVLSMIEWYIQLYDLLFVWIYHK